MTSQETSLAKAIASRRFILPSIGGIALALALLSVLSVLIRPAPADVFDPRTGYRLTDLRRDLPDTITGGTRITLDALEDLITRERPVLIDVLNNDDGPLGQMSFGLLEPKHTRHNIPGSYWIPDMGRGKLNAHQDRDLRILLSHLSDDNPGRPMVFYCIADCWVSWNAARRAISYGYQHVYWFREGTDLWRDAGLPLEESQPVDLARLVKSGQLRQ